MQPHLNALSKVGAYADMRALVTDEMVRTYGVVGTPRECAEQLQRRYGAVASDVCCYFPGYHPSRVDIAELTAAVKSLPAPPLVHLG
jgi:alkanesulfonate monooxygenase SsuD/methylene tetrahydromethanopterin reductase-like flavin-dependent oxidoreductase (luciferase family)